MSRKATPKEKRLVKGQQNRLTKAFTLFKNDEQKKATDTIKENTISFLIGPAGTGKSYLAISYAALSKVDGINSYELKKSVRHPLIKKIIESFDEIT